jgi:hypothetical protein
MILALKKGLDNHTRFLACGVGAGIRAARAAGASANQTNKLGM